MRELEKEREEEEFKKQKDELRRRKENKEAREAKEKWETEKARIQREKERKEKEERERHKREVLERMEEEKKVRLAQATVPTTDVIAPKKKEQDYNTCTIQIKLSNGQTLKQNFSPSDTLLVVHEWVGKNRTDGSKPFSLCNTFPRKVYSDQELKTITLTDAKLVPRGALIIQNK